MNVTPETKAQILRERAKALAREVNVTAQAGPFVEIVEFGLANERYALETAHVSEVCVLQTLTPVPCTPAYVRGLVNVRGRILTVIDIKKFFELPEEGITDLHRIILIQNDAMELGILADVVFGTRSIPVDAIQETLPTLQEIRADYLKGVTADRLVILDAPRILSDPRIIVNEEVEV